MDNKKEGLGIDTIGEVLARQIAELRQELGSLREIVNQHQRLYVDTQFETRRILRDYADFQKRMIREDIIDRLRED